MLLQELAHQFQCGVPVSPRLGLRFDPFARSSFILDFKAGR